MSRYARENAEEPPNHDWFAGQKRDPNLCLRCGKEPKLPPIVWRGKVVATPNLCANCEKEVMHHPTVRSHQNDDSSAAPTFDPKAAANLCRECEDTAAPEPKTP